MQWSKDTAADGVDLMNRTERHNMDWFVSGMMLVWYWAAGYKWKYIWLFSIAINVVWIIYAMQIKEYGLIASSAIIGGIGVRNHIKWRRDDERQKSQES